MVAAGVAPVFVPSRLLGQEKPSETLRLASIGTGRMGRGDMQSAVYQGLEHGARMVAVCDLDRNRVKLAKQTVEEIYRERLGEGQFERVETYSDYRELLEREDIDGVTISLPDHWHALVAIAAARAGKDMYLQKPLTYSVAEGQALVKAVRDNDVILQTGSQQRSSTYFRMACEQVRNGRLGQLERIHVTLPKDQGRGDPEPMSVPEALAYDFWLGPTPEAPYTEDRVHPQEGFGRPGWLQIEQYCRGMITGWGAHMYDIAQWAVGEDRDGGPVEIEASAEFPDRGLFDVHTDFEADGRYANGVRLTSGSGNPAGVRFEGEDGWIFVRRGSIEAHDREILRWEPGEGDVRLYRSPHHMGNFLQCMRSREEPAAPVEVGHRSNTVCVIHHIAMKLGRKLKWDPAAERFEDDAEANEMLDYPHREPWTL